MYLATDYRNSKRCIIDSLADARELYTRIAHLLPQSKKIPKSAAFQGGHWKVCGVKERMRFLR